MSEVFIYQCLTWPYTSFLLQYHPSYLLHSNPSSLPYQPSVIPSLILTISILPKATYYSTKPSTIPSTTISNQYHSNLQHTTTTYNLIFLPPNHTFSFFGFIYLFIE